MLLSCSVIPRSGAQIPVISPITGKYIETFTKIQASEAEFLKCKAYGTVLVNNVDVSTLTFQEALDVYNKSVKEKDNSNKSNNGTDKNIKVIADYIEGEPEPELPPSKPPQKITIPEEVLSRKQKLNAKMTMELSESTSIEKNGSNKNEIVTEQKDNSIDEKKESPTQMTASQTVYDNRSNNYSNKKKNNKINNTVV